MNAEKSTVATSLEAQVVSPHAADLINKILRDVHAEDARMRSEVLPDAPEGWHWAMTLESERSFEVGDVKVHLRYTLESDRG